MKQALQTTAAPAAIGPYSQAIISDDFLFCSGQIPLDPATGAKVEGGIEAQTARVLENIKGLLEARGLGFENVVKTTIFLLDLGQFKTVNEIYSRYFTAPFPARSTIQVAGLPMQSEVEIEIIARK